MNTPTGTGPTRIPWNKGNLTGQKPPLKLREVWAIRVRLQLSSIVRDLAIFCLAIDRKLRACDLTKLRVRDVCHGERIASRATVLQQKTQRPVQFEITEQTRESVEAWMRQAGLHAADFLFPSRIHDSPHLSTRQYARLVHRWIASIGLDDTACGTHTMPKEIHWCGNGCFWESGNQVAYQTGSLHFNMGCVLVDIASGRQLANLDCYRELAEDAPARKKALQGAQ